MPSNPFITQFCNHFNEMFRDALGSCPVTVEGRKTTLTMIREFLTPLLSSKLITPADVLSVISYLPQKYVFIVPVLNELSGGKLDLEEQYNKYLFKNVTATMSKRRRELSYSQSRLPKLREYLAQGQHVEYYTKEIAQQEERISRGIGVEFILSVIKRNAKLLRDSNPTITQEAVLEKVSQYQYPDLSQHEHMTLLNRIQAMRSLPSTKFAKTKAA